MPLPTTYRANGTVGLYDKQTSLKLLDYCYHHNIGILGFEGFLNLGDKYVPDLDWIADFSELFNPESGKSIEESIRLSRNILEKAPKNILFEFICSDNIQKRVKTT